MHPNTVYTFWAITSSHRPSFLVVRKGLELFWSATCSKVGTCGPMSISLHSFQKWKTRWGQTMFTTSVRYQMKTSNMAVMWWHLLVVWRHIGSKSSDFFCVFGSGSAKWKRHVRGAQGQLNKKWAMRNWNRCKFGMWLFMLQTVAWHVWRVRCVVAFDRNYHSRANWMFAGRPSFFWDPDHVFDTVLRVMPLTI